MLNQKQKDYNTICDKIAKLHEIIDQAISHSLPYDHYFAQLHALETEKSALEMAEEVQVNTEEHDLDSKENCEMEEFKITNKEQKQEAIAKLDQIEAIIDKSLEYGLPADHLFEQKNIIEEAIADYNAGSAEEVKEEGNQDAPFHRMFLLVEVDKEELDHPSDIDCLINGKRYRICNPETL